MLFPRRITTEIRKHQARPKMELFDQKLIERETARNRCETSQKRRETISRRRQKNCLSTTIKSQRAIERRQIAAFGGIICSPSPFAQQQQQEKIVNTTKTVVEINNWRARKQLEMILLSVFITLVVYLSCSLLPPTNQINLMPSSRKPRASQFELFQAASSPTTATATTTTRQQLRSISQTTNQQQANNRIHQQQQQQFAPSLASSSSQFSSGNPHNADAPKLIPLSALDQYQEGADLRLFCSASASQTGGRLQFEWRKNQAELLAPISNFEQQQQQRQPLEQLNSIGGQQRAQQQQQRLQISLMDESASVLRIGKLEADDAGNYTCLVRNQHGFDSSTVRVNVNVKLKWTREPPAEVQLRAGKSLHLECDATGQPEPLISWTNLKDQRTVSSKILRIDRVSVNDSALYECRATPSGDPLQSSGEKLRKLVRLIVNGK